MDASGKPVAGTTLLISNSANGPFAAKSQSQDTGSADGTTGSDGTFDLVGLDASQTISIEAAGNGYAPTSPTKVTLKGGGTVTQNITVAQLQIGNINGTVVTPDKQFGGIGVPVVLTGNHLTLSTVTAAVPPLNGTAIVLDDGSEISAFSFTGVPAGDYRLTLPASAVQGMTMSVPVTVTTGGTVTPTLTHTYPAWSEGTADATMSDPLTGSSLDARWKLADFGRPSAAGSAKESSSGLTVMADGSGWDIPSNTDNFTFIHQTLPAALASGDWVAYATVTAAPSSGNAGLMVASGSGANNGSLGNFSVSVSAGSGIYAQGRETDGPTRFPFGQTVASTDPNATPAGTQPNPPILLKIRKLGFSLAALESTDGGTTQHFAGHLTPQFTSAGTPLLVGLAASSLADGTLDQATFQNFVFAPLPSSSTPATNPPAAGGTTGQ